MSKHRPFCSAGLRLHDAITGEPQLYVNDPVSSARTHSGEDVLPSSNRRHAVRRIVAWALHHLNTTSRSPGPGPVIRNAGPSAPGFAP
jgi:hypothetical protein